MTSGQVDPKSTTIKHGKNTRRICGKEKNRCSARVSYAIKEITEGVIIAPIFKDTATLRRNVAVFYYANSDLYSKPLNKDSGLI